jgi:hypothetical protein
MRKYIMAVSEGRGLDGPYAYHINIDKIVYVRERYDGRTFIKVDGGQGIEVTASAVEIMERIADAFDIEEDGRECDAK